MLGYDGRLIHLGPVFPKQISAPLGLRIPGQEKNMTKFLAITAFCACLAGTLPIAAGQSAPPAHKAGIRGIVDPATGAFTATPPAIADENSAAAAIVPTTGKLVVAFTVKLVTPVPTGGALLCSVFADVSDTNPSTFQLNNAITEEATVKASVTGAVGNCTVTIPYSWNLTNASKDTVALQYTLSMAGGSTTATGFLTRLSSQFVVPGAGAVKVPANGATTNFTVAATI